MSSPTQSLHAVWDPSVRITLPTPTKTDASNFSAANNKPEQKETTVTNAIVFHQDIDLNGFKILNAGNPGGGTTPASAPLPEIIRWDDEEEFETADLTALRVLRQTRVNFARFAGQAALQLTVEADIKRDGAEGKQAQVLVAIDQGDDTVPPATLFGSAETASPTWVSLDFTKTIPLATGRPLLRLLASGTGRCKNVLVTIVPIPAPAPATP